MKQCRIQEARKAAKITQDELAKVLNVNRATLSRYESGAIDPPASQLQAIATALGVTVDYLLGGEPPEEKSSTFWTADLDDKLKCVGCSIGFYEEDAVLWINYPDGTLEVTEDDLKALNDSADSYLRFKLEELKEAHKSGFRPKK